LTKFFLKNLEISEQKGTFDVNLVFTATLACTKRALFVTKKALFITKKGTFSTLEKFGGGVHVPPGSYATGLWQACQQVVTMLLFYQVATRLSSTTC
jgi:hypothetical protein